MRLAPARAEGEGVSQDVAENPGVHPGPDIEPLALAPAQGEGESQAVAVAGPPVLVPAQGEGDSPALPKAKAKCRVRNFDNGFCAGASPSG